MKKLIFALFLILPFFLSSASAHLENGEDKTVNGYLVDFGYAPEKVIAGEPMNIAFNLVDPKTQQPIDPNNVWVRISSSDNIIFSGTFFPEAHHVLFTSTFPEAGDYEIKARFKDASDTVLVETNFNLNVGEKGEEPSEVSFWGKIWDFLKFW